MSPEKHPLEFDRILADILRFEESGEKRTVDEWCAMHPQHGDALREFFADREQLGLTRVFGPVADMATLIGDAPPGQLPAVGESIHYFGDYEIQEELARGGMGVVYKATQKSLGRTVALKMILAGELASELHVARFRTEAEAAARLDHPGIVPIYEIGEHNGQHYFSMAYISGQSLADRLSSGPLAARSAAEIVANAASAVQYAHDLEVIHRDLKPANILMDGDRPKITDFGLAKRLDKDSMTATGEVLGTPGFMAPEQASNAEGADKSTDVYGLGAILYATLTGRPPFQAANVVETLVQLVETDPVAPRQLNPAVPADLETICMAALRKEPGRRYASAAALEADLRRYLENRPILARPVSTMEHVVKWAKRRPMTASLSATLLLTLLMGSVIISSLWISERSARLDAIRAAERATENEREATVAKEDAFTQARIAEQNLVTSSLSVADLMYINGQTAEAEQRYLAEYKAARSREDGDRRSWWRLWRTYAEHPCVRRLPVTGSHVASSADGKYIAVVSGRKISLLDGTSLELLHTLSSPIGTLRTAEFSPDSRFLCANHFSHAPLLVWDAADPDREPQQFTLAPVELKGIRSVVAPVMTDAAGLARINRSLNLRVGFGFDDNGVLLACGPDALWAFDVANPDAEPARVASRQRQNVMAGITDDIVARWKNRYWVTGFGSLFGVPLTVVDVLDNGTEQYSYLGIEGSKLISIKLPQTVVSSLGIPETWRVLPAEQREQLIVSSVFAIHAATHRMAVIEDDVLSTWDLKTGAQLGEFKWPKSNGRQRQQDWTDTRWLVFSHDGQTLAAVGAKIRILSVAAPKRPSEFGWFGNTGLTGVCFTGDGKHILATDGSDMSRGIPIRVYPVESEQMEWSKVGIRQHVAADGTALQIEHVNGPTLLDWTLPTIRMIRGGKEKILSLPRSAGMKPNRGLVASADASRIVVAGTSTDSAESGQVFVGFETQTGVMFGPHQLTDAVVGHSLSPDGDLLTGLNSEHVVLHSLPDFRQVGEVNILRDALKKQELANHRWSLTHRATAYSHDRSLVAVIFNPVQIDIESAFIHASKGEELALIDVAAAAVVEQKPFSGASQVMFLHGGGEIAVGKLERTAKVDFHSLPDLTLRGTWQLGSKRVTALAEDSRQHLLVAATQDGKLWFWDMQRQEPLIDIEFTDKPIVQLQFPDDGNRLRAETYTGTLSLNLKPAADLVEKYTQ